MPHACRLLLFVLLIVAIACGGGGSGSAQGVVPGGGGGSTNLAGALNPDESSPGPKTVALSQGLTSGPSVSVRVDVTGIPDLFGAALEVVFDPAVVEFHGYRLGSVIAAPLEEIVEASPGRIVIGIGSTSGTSGDVLATRMLLELDFRVTEAGTSRVELTGDLLDGSDPPQSIPTVSTFGGTMVAN